MAVGKPTALIHAKYLSLFMALGDDEAGKLIKHFMQYINDLHPVAPDRLTEIGFEPIKAQLKIELKTWRTMCSKNRTNGKNGGRPAKNQTIENPTEPKEPIGLFEKPQTEENSTQTIVVSAKVKQRVAKIAEAERFIRIIEPEWVEVVTKWLTYKKERQENYKGQISLNTMLTSLKKMSENNPVMAMEIVNYSIGNNYSGIFKLKNNAVSKRNLSETVRHADEHL